MPAGSSRHIEPLLPDTLGDPIAWQDGSVLRWQSGEAIVWQSYFGPSVQWVRQTRPRVPLVALRRRGRSTFVVPTTAVITAPNFVADLGQARTMRGVSRARRRATEVVPAQVVVAPSITFTVPQPRRLRGLGPLRVRRVERVPGQHVVTVAAPKRTDRISLLARRARRVEVVQTQTAPVVDPSVMWSPPHAPRRVLVLRRRARVEVVPTQAATIDRSVMWSPTRTPRRVLVRRPRARLELVPAQELPQSYQSKRPRLIGRRTGRSRPVEVVPTQVVVVAPQLPLGVPRSRTFRGTLQRRRARVETPLTQAAPVVDASVMWSPTRAPRRVLVARRRARVELVPPQFNPPFPHARISQPRRVRGMQPRRRARVETQVPTRIYFPKIRLF